MFLYFTPFYIYYRIDKAYIVKLVGGLQKVLKFLEQISPKCFNSYHERFVGRGSLLFGIVPISAYISDINEELMETYKTLVKPDNSLIVRSLILKYFSKNPRKMFEILFRTCPITIFKSEQAA